MMGPASDVGGGSARPTVTAWWRVMPLVALGGAMGATARFSIDRLVLMLGESAMAGTLVVNVLGAYLLGLIFVRLDPRGPRSIDIGIAMTDLPGSLGRHGFLSAVLATGFCGAFTTYSALGYELWSLLKDGRWATACGWLVAMLSLGLAGLVCGVATGRRFRPS